MNKTFRQYNRGTADSTCLRIICVPVKQCLLAAMQRGRQKVLLQKVWSKTFV